MARVRLEGIRKIYSDPPGHVAVHGVDLDIVDGELVVLVGPSGCGKSTTLRMIAGLESITEGELFIDDLRVNDTPPKDRDIAMVFQSYALYPHMTVRENLGFALKLRGTPRSEIEERVALAAKTLGIEGFLDRTPRQLSGGQRQRVALGRAIVRQPKVFLFDEPLSNLDAKLRVQMRREIARLHQDLSATMIYVTHDQVEAMTLGDRIVVMNNGHVQQIDTPMRLYESPANLFVAGFIGSPAMNLIAGEIRNDMGLRFVGAEGRVSLDLPPGAGATLAQMDGKSVTLGIRPENVSLAADDASSGSSIPVRLDLVEALGNEVFLYGSIGDISLTSRTTAQSIPHPGHDVVLDLDLDRAHFFDQSSGLRLGGSPS